MYCCGEIVPLLWWGYQVHLQFLICNHSNHCVLAPSSTCYHLIQSILCSIVLQCECRSGNSTQCLRLQVWQEFLNMYSCCYALTCGWNQGSIHAVIELHSQHNNCAAQKYSCVVGQTRDVICCFTMEILCGLSSAAKNACVRPYAPLPGQHSMYSTKYKCSLFCEPSTIIHKAIMPFSGFSLFLFLSPPSLLSSPFLSPSPLTTVV